MQKDKIKKFKKDKSYGQNFLIDQNVLQKIVAAGEITSTDFILEIGAGQGVLTTELAKRAGRVLSLEVDPRLIPELQEKFVQEKNVEIKNIDVLFFEIKTLNKQPYKIIANIPYNLTSKILTKFLFAKYKPKLMVLLVQKEVAQRICAVAGENSFLTIIVQYFGQPEILQIIKPSSFNPPPQVDSAILKIASIKQQQNFEQEKFFFQLVKIGFSQKRKMLKKNLKALFPEAAIKQALEQTKLLEQCRAEDLSLVDWLKLAENLSKIKLK